MGKKNDKRGELASDLSTRGLSKADDRGSGSEGQRNGAARTKRVKPPAVGTAGVPGSKNPERRCTATVRSTGNRCKRAAIKGGFVCTSHGGASPQVRKKARERLIELVDPALGALHKVLSDKDADDAVKVRAALGILDRTGYGPGATIKVEGSKFDEMLAGAIGMNPDTGVIELDRSLDTPALSSGGGEDDWDEDAIQHGLDARTEAWSDLNAEDERPFTTRFDRFGPNVVKGEVVTDDGPGPFPPDPPTGPGEYGR